MQEHWIESHGSIIYTWRPFRLIRRHVEQDVVVVVNRLNMPLKVGSSLEQTSTNILYTKSEM